MYAQKGIKKNHLLSWKRLIIYKLTINSNVTMQSCTFILTHKSQSPKLISAVLMPVQKVLLNSKSITRINMSLYQCRMAMKWKL